MNKLTTTLETGDLRPKERVLLLVQNHAAKDTTGKEILTEADKHALSEGWRPKNNEEVREYNQYTEGATLMAAATIDAQTTFLNAQMAHFRKLPLTIQLIESSHHREMQALLKRLTSIKRTTIHEALAITEQQKAVKLHDGLDFEYAVYELAFESLAEEDQKRFVELYPDIETDHQYLDQEEIIARMLGGKDELGKKNKEKLAALVAEKSYNSFAKEYQLFHYFACIPLAEVARHFLINKGIEVDGKPLEQNQEADDEDSMTHEDIQKAMEAYAEEHSITIEVMLKKSCLIWLDEDLFEQYCPLVLSGDSDLFKRWLHEKREASSRIKKHIAKDELSVRSRSKDEWTRDKLYSKGLYDDELEKARREMDALAMEARPGAKGELDEKVAFASFSETVITGDSLYTFKSDWVFVKEFKERVDRYDPNLGLVYADDDTKHEGTHLDQELLIADTTDTGEFSFFSMFGLMTRRLGLFIDSQEFFEEIEEDGGTTLTFKDKRIEQAFIQTKDDLVEGYATLLSFNQMFKKLSTIYEVDVTYDIQKWLTVLEKCIDDHNNALDKAAGKVQDEEKGVFRKKLVLKIDSELYIDKENIKPNSERTKDYFEEFQAALGSEFGWQGIDIG
jgi:hypothetical protein